MKERKPTDRGDMCIGHIGYPKSKNCANCEYDVENMACLVYESLNEHNYKVRMKSYKNHMKGLGIEE